MYSVFGSISASVFRTSEMCCARLFSSTCVSGQTSAAAWKRASASPLVGWWWGLYIAAGFLDRAALRFSGPDDVETGLWCSLVSNGFGVAAALMGMELVRRVSMLQEWARTHRG